MGEAQELFSERATPFGPGLLAKKYIFQVCSDDGREHFQNLSQLYPGVSFVLVYGWDGWNEYSYGSHFISRGRARSYPISVRAIEKAMAKHGVDDNPNDEWPYEPEINAEMELMDLAEAHWQKSLLRETAP